jgi:hypothetical protein
MKSLLLCLKSRKTTLAGIGGIALGLGILLTALGSGEAVDWEAAVVPIVAGIGLLFAKDGDKRSVDLQGKCPKEGGNTGTPPPANPGN